MPYFDEYTEFDQNMREGGETPTPPPAPDKSGGTTAAHTIFDYVELLVLTVFFVLIATTFFFRHTVVVGPSMMNTLEDGEHLIISDAFYSPDCGDIVVIESEVETGISTPIIKRIVATAGDIVEVKHDGIYRNGVLLDEPYVRLESAAHANENYISFGRDRYLSSAANPSKTVYTYHVGEGEVFILGDNRFDSTDGRMFGTVSEDCILGRVLFRLTPFEKLGGVD